LLQWSLTDPTPNAVEKNLSHCLSGIPPFFVFWCLTGSPFFALCRPSAENGTFQQQQRKIIMKLARFQNFLRQRPDDEQDADFYATNKALAADMGVKAMFDDRYDFWALVEQAPENLNGKKDALGISLDVLWAEEQIQNAFEQA
jgi:hypothetical protein